MLKPGLGQQLLLRLPLRLGLLPLLLLSLEAGARVSQVVPLPPVIFPSDSTSYTIVPRNDSILDSVEHFTPPYEFPDNSSNYTIINNSTLLKTLKHHAEHPSEVEDLVGHPQHHREHHSYDENASSRVSQVQEKTNKDAVPLEDEVEEIQPDDGAGSEDRKKEVVSTVSETQTTGATTKAPKRHGSQKVEPHLDGEVAAVLAGVFLLLAIVVYVGLFLFRRLLELRYGNREMLIDEDDVVDYNDLKNFEI